MGQELWTARPAARIVPYFPPHIDSHPSSLHPVGVSRVIKDVGAAIMAVVGNTTPVGDVRGPGT